MHIHAMPPIACRKKNKESFPEQTTPPPRPREMVDRYLAGNFHERLDLWLTHRDLRQTFTRLEKAID